MECLKNLQDLSKKKLDTSREYCPWWRNQAVRRRRKSSEGDMRRRNLKTHSTRWRESSAQVALERFGFLLRPELEDQKGLTIRVNLKGPGPITADGKNPTRALEGRANWQAAWEWWSRFLDSFAIYPVAFRFCSGSFTSCFISVMAWRSISVLRINSFSTGYGFVLGVVCCRGRQRAPERGGGGCVGPEGRKRAEFPKTKACYQGMKKVEMKVRGWDMSAPSWSSGA